MSRPRWVLLAASLLTLAVAAGVVAEALAVARAPASAVESGLATAGYRVQRSASTPLVAAGDPAPDVLALVKPPRLMETELDHLRAFVDAGGELWIVSADPEGALFDDLRPHVGTYPGFIYAQDGTPGRLVATTGGAPFAVTGAESLRVEDIAWTPLLTADERNFRDSNGDGTLQTGEPSGPFVVAASIPHGEGRVVVVALDPASAAALPASFYGGPRSGAAVVIDYQEPGAWAGPARTLLTLLALPTASLIAAGIVLAVGLAAAALAFADASPPRKDEAAARASDVLRRLEDKLAAEGADHPFRAILRERE